MLLPAFLVCSGKLSGLGERDILMSVEPATLCVFGIGDDGAVQQ
jgi:hypothetical protein